MCAKEKFRKRLLGYKLVYTDAALLLEPRGDSFAKTYQENIYDAGLPVIVFGVDDLSGEMKKLKENGVKFREDLTKKEWGLENLFEDSSGNLIMLQGN